ncbi:Sirtuin family [Penicillium cosmopolitanum]|uniref:NAD-dependent protein deacetylase n=1 Tax=Penicillium cosmopolitanum TaxID=1131564 RepID=A0A9W9SCJ9_9EURO|nr:Sirtuin family [Penicillium cosmopolitanum]KAJ5376143.1 Sirtuin family [Penicillium cosmopolitanum]
MSNPPIPTTAKPKNTIQSIADRIKTNQITRIIVLTGAGISTSAGIPDFRTPKTGLYDRLAPLKLPSPESIFHISYFSHSPEPFYAIAQARHPTTLKPTLSHAFLALLAKKNLLHFLFTQNIDGLEEDAGVPAEKILWTHGNWKDQHCSKCKSAYPDNMMRKAIRAGDVPYCLAPKCDGAIKPDVVFFGESLPEEFDEKVKLIPEADLMIVMGTSLRVAPCSGIQRMMGPGVPRVLINMERCGDMGSQDGDVCILGDCDEGVSEFAEALGWGDELKALWEEVVAVKEAKAKIDGNGGEDEDGPDLDACIAKMAAQMDERLGISKGHKKMLESHLSDKFARMMAGSRPAS